MLHDPRGIFFNKMQMMHFQIVLTKQINFSEVCKKISREKINILHMCMKI